MLGGRGWCRGCVVVVLMAGGAEMGHPVLARFTLSGCSGGGVC